MFGSAVGFFFSKTEYHTLEKVQTVHC